jgi:hypothetical protein
MLHALKGEHMNLYEINTGIETWEPEIDPETGEVLNFAALDELQMARDEKIENVALYIKNLKAAQNAIRDEEKALAERRKVLESKTTRLTDYLQEALNGEKFSTVRVAISYRKSKAVEIAPEFTAWAKENADNLLRYKEPEPDKTAIKELLQSGVTLEYAALAENVSMQIK